MTEQQAEQENRSDQDTWSGRTCPEHIRATKERTSDVSSKKSAKSQKEMFQFLDLRKTSGGGGARRNHGRWVFSRLANT